MEAIKEHLYKLIEGSQNADLLAVLTQIMEQNEQEGEIWRSLSEDQKERIQLAESEIDYPEKQVSHEEMVRRNKKWLR
ncbi:MAG: hypothetical protein HEP71_30435 [Roseivirga sp.]|nr:hypothetical protein [Roseivirga sp.]